MCFAGVSVCDGHVLEEGQNTLTPKHMIVVYVFVSDHTSTITPDNKPQIAQY